VPESRRPVGATQLDWLGTLFSQRIDNGESSREACRHFA